MDQKLRRIAELMAALEREPGSASGMEELFGDDRDLGLVVYNIADLTVRLPDHRSPNLLLTPAGAEIDEDSPLFGRADEGSIFFAEAEDVATLITQNVQPGLWETGAAEVRPTGNAGLLVIANADVQKGVKSYLDALRRSVGHLITVEIRFLGLQPGVRIPAGEMSRERGDALLDAAAKNKGFFLIHSARITGFAGQRMAFYRGTQQAFVQDYDVEVAEDADIADPIVGVLQTGLSFDVRAVRRGVERIVLDLRLQAADLRSELRVIETTAGLVSTPDLSFAEVSTTLSVPVDGYVAIRAADRGVLLISAGAEKLSGGAR